MDKSDKVLGIIFASMDEVNEICGDKYDFEKTKEEILFGDRGKLDSLDLVNLLVAIEDRIETELSIQITIANDRAMSEEHSPFRTVNSLCSFIVKEIENENV